MASEGTLRFWMYRDYCGVALIPDILVIPGSSGSLQIVDHTLIDVPLASVYLNSPYYKGTLQSDVCQFHHIPCDNW